MVADRGVDFIAVCVVANFNVVHQNNVGREWLYVISFVILPAAEIM
jgi:hypothetical protein